MDFSTTTRRQSNFELLRIISMILIVMSHCDEIFGLSNLYGSTLGVNKIITDLLHIGGQIGVGCFLLISGYFMVNQNFSLKRLMKLCGEVWFYSVGFWLLWIFYVVVFHRQITLITILRKTILSLFPILFSQYWFVTAYVILVVMSPFFNKFIFSLDKETYWMFLVCILTIFVLLIGVFREY